MSSKRAFAAWALAVAILGSGGLVFADALEQQTADLRVLHQKYLRAGGLERAALLPRLETAAAARAETLREILIQAPGAVFHVTIPEDVFATLPPSVQRLVEQAVTREGTLEAPHGSAAHYQLRDRQGRRASLIPVGTPPPFTEGASAKIQGCLFEGALYFRPAGFTPLSRSGADRQAPTVTIQAPAQGAALAGAVEVRVQAADDTRVREIELFRNGKTLGRTEANPARFSWNTRLEADGPHTLTAQATDPDLNTGAAAALSVVVDNTPPRVELTAPTAGSILAASATLSAQASDAIGVAAVKFLADGRVIATLVKAPYTFSWDASALPNGGHALTAHAVDRAGNETASAPVAIKLMNTNRKAPRLLPLSDKSVHEGSALTFKVLANDPDGPDEPLQYTAERLPPWAVFDIARQEFSGSPDFDAASHTHPTTVYDGLTFKVCDPQPLCDEQQLAITVVNVNRPPLMQALGDHVLLEGQPLTVTPVVTDPDGDALRCQVQGAPAWLKLDPATCVLSGTPGLEEASQAAGGKIIPAIGVQACDPLHECVSQVFSIRLLNSNQRPALQFVGDQQAEEGRLLRLSVQATDADSPRLTLEAAGLPYGAQFRDLGAGRGELTWTPRADQAGTHECTITVDDGRQTDTQAITLMVAEKSLAIAGCIVNELKKPAPNITVKYGRAGEPQRESKTDGKGCYLASDLRPGGYTLRPAFSMGNVPTGEAVFFDPMSRRVELKTQDVRDINFLLLTRDEY